jgi:CubicO group peptidase (beta-lactamase class C family)
MKTQTGFKVSTGIALLSWMVLIALGNHQAVAARPVPTQAPLSSAVIADLERYVKRTMRRLKTPGVAMVLVQGETVVYKRGFGVRDLETKAPVTTDTLFGIGSSTKPMTAVAIASLVDQGVIDWDDKIVDVLPSFALSSEQLTFKVTFQDALSMSTGVPRRMEEISVRYGEMDAQAIVESLAAIPLAGPYRQRFNYSSRMLATGGYAAALAASSEHESLEQGYARLMQERVLDPLDMTASTFSISDAVAGHNYATPHYCALEGCAAISPELEGMFTPIAPAGALWSNAGDLAQFLLMALKGGLSADGRRVVSPENLAHLWEQRIAIDAEIGYGLGWHVENYSGLTVYHHPGGTVGFSSELVVIP